MGVFYSFKLFLPAFGGLSGRGRGSAPYDAPLLQLPTADTYTKQDNDNFETFFSTSTFRKECFFSLKPNIDGCGVR
jgi:hypothetical protein